jgi:hypothetical protein
MLIAQMTILSETVDVVMLGDDPWPHSTFQELLQILTGPVAWPWQRFWIAERT